MAIAAKVRLVAWVALTVGAAHGAQARGISEVAVLVGAVLLAGGATALARRVLGDPWAVAGRAGAGRAAEEAVVKTLGMLGMLVLAVLLTPGCALLAEMALELILTWALRALLRRWAGRR